MPPKDSRRTVSPPINSSFCSDTPSWLRKKPEEALDGLPVHDQGIEDWLTFAGPALIRTFDRGKGQAARDRDIAVHSPMLVVLGTEADDAPSWLSAGQALQSVLLRARSEDVWASFLCQPSEVPELRNEIASICGRPNPQILLRLGYGEEVSPTPRRSVRSVLLGQAQHHT